MFRTLRKKGVDPQRLTLCLERIRTYGRMEKEYRAVYRSGYQWNDMNSRMKNMRDLHVQIWDEVYDLSKFLSRPFQVWLEFLAPAPEVLDNLDAQLKERLRDIDGQHFSSKPPEE